MRIIKQINLVIAGIKPCLLFAVLCFFVSLPIAWAESLIPPDAVEVPYVWKRGDSLSKVLFSLGIGRKGEGPRLYGRDGWVARNETFYKRKNWDTTPEGQHILLITPKTGLPPLAKPNIRPIDTVSQVPVVEALSDQETLREVETSAAIAEPNVAPVAKPTVAPVAPKPPATRGVKPSNTSNPELKTRIKSKDIGLALYLLAFFILTYASFRWRLKTVREKKTAVVANSVLVWLTSNGQHSIEHISLATTLFVGDMSDRPMVAYEVMGYFNKDCEQLEIFKNLLKTGNKNQIFSDVITADQQEFLIKYFYAAPGVLATVIGTSTLPFLQIRTLRTLSQFAADYPHEEKVPQLAQAFADACARFPTLVGNSAVRSEVRHTLTSLEAFKRDSTAA